MTSKTKNRIRSGHCIIPRSFNSHAILHNCTFSVQIIFITYESLGDNTKTSVTLKIIRFHAAGIFYIFNDFFHCIIHSQSTITMPRLVAYRQLKWQSSYNCWSLFEDVYVSDVSSSFSRLRGHITSMTNAMPHGHGNAGRKLCDTETGQCFDDSS